MDQRNLDKVAAFRKNGAGGSEVRTFNFEVQSDSLGLLHSFWTSDALCRCFACSEMKYQAIFTALKRGLIPKEQDSGN